MSKDQVEGKAIAAANAAIGKLLGHQPVTRWAVMNPGRSSICFQPESTGARGKREAEEWLADNRLRFPTGWVATGGYQVAPLEEWPNYLSEGETATDEFISQAIARTGPIRLQAAKDGAIRIVTEDGKIGCGPTVEIALAAALGVIPT